MNSYMGHFGLSYIGIVYLLMIWLPNTMWARNKPAGYDPSGENMILLILERSGQMLCTASILLFKDTNPVKWEPWIGWFIASVLLMVLYEFYWVRYFRGNRNFQGKRMLLAFYCPYFGIPVPGASLPVAAFLLLGIYGRLIWLIAASIILGIGHIGIHIQHVRRLTISKFRITRKSSKQVLN